MLTVTFIAKYQVFDSTSDPSSGHWSINEVVQGTNVAIECDGGPTGQHDIPERSGADQLYVRASDGMLWSAWKPFTVMAPVVPNLSEYVTLSNTALSAGRQHHGHRHRHQSRCDRSARLDRRHLSVSRLNHHQGGYVADDGDLAGAGCGRQSGYYDLQEHPGDAARAIWPRHLLHRCHPPTHGNAIDREQRIRPGDGESADR